MHPSLDTNQPAFNSTLLHQTPLPPPVNNGNNMSCSIRGSTNLQLGQKIISFGSCMLENDEPVSSSYGHNGGPHVDVDGDPSQHFGLVSAYGFDFQQPELYGNANANALKKKTTKQADHVLSERRRRERLAQQFLQLTAALPTFNSKMDKASILERAMKYIKQLQDRVKFLEEHIKLNNHGSSSGPRSLVDEDVNSGSNYEEDENFCFKTNLIETPPPPPPPPRQPPPVHLEIPARIKHRKVLIRIDVDVIYREYNEVLIKVLDKIGELNLTPVSSSAMPFGTSTLLLTVTAQMGEGFHVTLKDLVNHLRLSLQ